MGFKNAIVYQRKKHYPPMTQDDLSKALGITRTDLSFYETGQRLLDVDHLDKIARVLGCLPTDIYPQAILDIIVDKTLEQGEQ